LLGVCIDDNLTWEKRAQDVLKKVNYKIPIPARITYHNCFI